MLFAFLTGDADGPQPQFESQNSVHVFRLYSFFNSWWWLKKNRPGARRNLAFINCVGGANSAASARSWNQRPDVVVPDEAGHAGITQASTRKRDHDLGPQPPRPPDPPTLFQLPIAPRNPDVDQPGFSKMLKTGEMLNRWGEMGYLDPKDFTYLTFALF